MGGLEKTDRIDAGIIARFAQAGPAADAAAEPGPAAPQGPRRPPLPGHRRSHRQKQRRASLLDNAEMLASLEEVIALLKRQRRTPRGRDRLDDRRRSPVGRSPAFRSIKGVADRTVARLMAEMPEIGTYSNKAIAKLVGLAPIADDSGKRSGKRLDPRRPCRRPLHPLLRRRHRRRTTRASPPSSDRLHAAGKAKMVIRIALARKLLVRLNAKARDARAQYANSSATTPRPG